MTVLDPATANVIGRAMEAARAGNLAQACEIGESALGSAGDGAVHAMLGMLRCRNGDFERGIQHLRAARDAQPGDLTIASNLAAALVETGRFAEALDVASEDAMRLDASARLARMRGFAAQSLGRMPDAVQAYRLVVAREPRDWESWNNLGNAQSGLGDHQGAVESLRQAHRINPNSAATSVNLADALIRVGEFDEAEQVLRKSVEADPADGPALNLLAPLLRGKQLNYEAAELYARAVEANPNEADLQVSYGRELSEIHRPQLALAAFERALEIDPRHSYAYVNLAQQLEFLNREPEISSLVKRAVSAGAPPGAIAFMQALDHKRAGRFREGLDAVERIGSAADAEAVEHLRGLFLERLGDHDAAFAAYERMKSPLFQDISNPEGRGARYRWVLREHYEAATEEWAARWQDRQPTDSRSSPAFIVGFPRSGTTLLDTMLMSHPKIEVMEEEPAIRDAGGPLPDLAEYPAVEAEKIQAGRDAYFATAAGLTELKPGNLLVDKNPLAMNSLALIHRLFPDAKVILALRHPCDVVLSCFITKFRINAGMANFIRLDTTAELYDLSFSYFERIRQLLPVSVHTIRYEDLVEDTGRELKSVCEFLGVEWSEALLDHQSTARKRANIKTASYAQVVEPVYKRAAGRWQHYRKHLEPVIPILRPWAEKFGYEI